MKTENAATPPVTAWLPTNPPRPCPPLLTEDEAVVYLRLDTLGVQRPRRTLKRYRDEGKLVAVPIGNHLFYRQADLDAFIESQRRDYMEHGR